jgi:uncharacterized protein (DUF885 family)
MRSVLKWFSWFVLLVVVLVGAALIHVWYFKPAKIDWFYDRLFASYALQTPEFMSSLRMLPPWLDFYGGKLDDASPSAEQERVNLSRSGLETLHRYDRNALDTEGRLSYDTLDYFLQIQVDGDKFRDHDFPVNQLFGVQSTLPDFMVQIHQVTTPGEAERYIERLNKFPLKFDQLLESLKLREDRHVIPPQFTVEKVLTQMEGFIAKPPTANVLYVSFKEKLDKIPGDRLDAAERERFLGRVDEAIQKSVYPSYRRLIDYFNALKPKAVGNFGAWHLPDGDAYYAWCVRQETTTELTPQEVHELGLQEVARVTVEMDAILKQRGLSQGGIGARMRELAQDPSLYFANTPEGKREMLARYQAILDEANKNLGDAFDVRAKSGMEVKAIPEFAQATAPMAYYSPGSLDGSRPGVFFANTRNTRDTPKFSMPTVAYHEGIPGHHFQGSIAHELTDVAFFRKVIPFTSYHEGWALYAERLAWELGFEKDPLDNLGRLRDEMLRSVRLVVDTGIHYKHWTREQAIEYMSDNTGMAQADVTVEIERYFVQPGQALAYKVGMLKILALREKAKQTLGPKFELKQFHNQVLTHGALPLVVLERVVDDWIAKTKGT